MITTIGNEAFKGCSNLTTFTIPSAVTMIGNEAFKGCNNLNTIKFGVGQKSFLS
jgi:hypothetical protein